jgi:hypothetical protein
MQLPRRVILVALLLLSLSPVWAASLATAKKWPAHTDGAPYLCQTPEEAREQDINPDYLVPGCALQNVVANLIPESKGHKAEHSR